MTTSTPDGAGVAAGADLRERVRRFVESERFRRAIIAVIVVNAAVLGLETSPTAMAAAGPVLTGLDAAALVVFIVEIALKLFAYRLRFFRDPWRVFDLAVVAVSLVPAGEGMSVLRALRVLRAFRLISVAPRMRLVAQALLGAIPGMGSVVALLVLIFYVAAVMATRLFGPSFDAYFGTIGRSAYTLFQIMTLESWSMGIVRPVMEIYPYAWAFFVPFILIVTFAVLNLFIAIIVNSMQEAAHEQVAQEVEAHDRHMEAMMREMVTEVRALRAELAAIRHRLPAEATESQDPAGA